MDRSSSVMVLRPVVALPLTLVLGGGVEGWKNPLSCRLGSGKLGKASSTSVDSGRVGVFGMGKAAGSGSMTSMQGMSGVVVNGLVALLVSSSVSTGPFFNFLLLSFSSRAKASKLLWNKKKHEFLPLLPTFLTALTCFCFSSPRIVSTSVDDRGGFKPNWSNWV